MPIFLTELVLTYLVGWSLATHDAIRLPDTKLKVIMQQNMSAWAICRNIGTCPWPSGLMLIALVLMQ